MPILNNQDMSVYRMAEGLNYSAIKEGVTKSLKHMRYAITAPSKPSTSAQEKGTLIHLAVLEPDKFAARVAVYTGESKRTKEYKEFCAANADKMILTPEEHCEFENIKHAVFCNDWARELVTTSQHEVSCYWETESAGKCKARFDIYCKDGAVWDLKTVADLGMFEYQIRNYGYYLQAGWYSTGSEMQGNFPDVPFGWIAVETKPPYDCAVIPCGFSAITEGAKRCIDVAMAYRKAEKTGHFPGMFENGEPYELPAYMIDEQIDID